jgi:hypothetical protein
MFLRSIFLLVVTLTSATLFGCASAEVDETSASDAISAPGETPHLYRVGVKTKTPSYSCGANGVCTCYGDDDCNAMFSSGACAGAAICHDDATGSWCECVGGSATR